MKRREFIAGLIGAATASPILCPLTVRAQQPERMRRVALFMEPDRKRSRLIRRFSRRGLVQELQRLGWTEGRNVRFDFRWGAGE